MTKIRKKWLIIGAGRLGLGFVAENAHCLGFEVNLRPGSRDASKGLREILERRATTGGLQLRTLISDSAEICTDVPAFHVVKDDADLLEILADAATRVVSTSVGMSNIETVAATLAAGLRRRRAAGTKSPLLILACENGRNRANLTADEWLKRLLSEDGSDDRSWPVWLSEQVTIPPVVVDCIVPEFPSHDGTILRSPGRIWVQRTTLVDKLLRGGNDLAQLQIVDDIRGIRVLKFYAVNSTHAFLAALGAALALNFIHEVLQCRDLASIVLQLTSSIRVAIQNRVAELEVTSPANVEVQRFCDLALERMSVSKLKDPGSRIVSGIEDDRYLTDGRLDGPLFDLGANATPMVAEKLVHAFALCVWIRMHRYGSRPLRSSETSYVGHLIVEGTVDPIDHFVSELLLARPGADYNVALLDAVKRDLSRLKQLEASKGTDWAMEDVIALFETTIEPMDDLTRPLEIQCVAFDLDEGLVTSESLLYEVTRAIIRELSPFEGADITQDEYAEYVGLDESQFWEAMRREYRLEPYAEELVTLRSEYYLAKLEKQDASTMCKPGFRPLLEELKAAEVPTAVVSNASTSRARATLERAGLTDYFADVVCSDQDGMRAKPDPSMYQYLQNKYAVSPEHMVVVESSSIGVAAARAAGCYVALTVNDFTLLRSVSKSVACFGNARDIRQWFSHSLSPRRKGLSGTFLGLDDGPFPFTPGSYRSGLVVRSLSVQAVADSIAKRILTLQDGTSGRSFVGLTGTMGAGKRAWARQIMASLARHRAHVLILPENDFVLDEALRSGMRQDIFSLHDTWIRWAAFERQIAELQNNPDGVLQYEAYNRDSGKIDTPETLSYRADTIVLIPGLYNLTDFHKEIDYQLNVAFTTTVAEGMRRERAELQQIGRRSESEIEAVIRNVYLPMRLRIQRSLADRDIHPSLEVDVTPNMPAVPINKRGEIEWLD